MEYTNNQNDETYKKALNNAASSDLAATQQNSSLVSKQQKQAVQPTAPTDVVSTKPNYNQRVRAAQGMGYSNERGLRAVLDPYGSRGYRPLKQMEKDGLQQQYRNMANMKGLSARQRDTNLRAIRSDMGNYGMTPTFNLESNKGLSQRRSAENMVGNARMDRGLLDQQQKLAGMSNMHNYYRNRYLDDYERILWGRE